MADNTFTFRVDQALKAAFSEVAAAQEHTAAQLLRLLMRDEIRLVDQVEWIGERNSWAAIDVGDAIVTAVARLADPSCAGHH